MSRCFSFPVLKKEELCKKLADAGAPKLSVDNLISPSPDVLIPVYDFFCLDLGEESLQPDFVALGEYHDLHLDSYALLESSTHSGKFMAAAGAKEFSVLKDIYRPESQRTIAFLSAAINYMMHSKSKMPFLYELLQKRAESFADVEKIKEEEHKTEMEIAQIEQERATEHPQVEALEMEIKELNNKLQALNKQHHAMTLDINTLKQEDASILDKISSLDFEIMQKQQEGVHIKSQVVENPTELQKMLQEKKLALIEEEALETNAEAWKAKNNVISKAEKKCLKLQKMVQTVIEQVNDRNADNNLLKERKERFKALEKEEFSLDTKNVELKLEVQRSGEHLEKYLKLCDERSEKLQALKARQEQRRIDHNAGLQAVCEREKQTEALQKMHGDILAGEESQRLRLRAILIKLIEMKLSQFSWLNSTETLLLK